MRQYNATKTCNTCGIEKPVEEFSYQGNVRKDGTRPRKSRCKQCIREYSVAYRKANPDVGRGYYLANKERIQERKRQHYNDNREVILESNRAYKKTEAGRSSIRKTQAKRDGDKYRGVPMRHYLEVCPEDQCYWCGCHITEDTRDLEHVMPISKGGEAKSYNETWSCRDCNRGTGGKHSKHPLVWIAELVSRPDNQT